MRRIEKVAAACLVSLLSVAGLGAETAGPDVAEAEPAPQSATSGTPVSSAFVTTAPSLISRPEIVHPGLDREAMVYVNFLVSPEGATTEVAVDEDRGFHTEAFRKAALDFVRAMKFKPATMNGVPVVHGPLTQPVIFGFGQPREEQGVTPAFRRELNKVQKLLEDRDYDGAHFHAEWMLREKVKFSYEFAVLQAQLAQTLAIAGRHEEALVAVRAATGRSSSEAPGFTIGAPPPRNDASRYLLPRDLVVYLLQLRMRLLVQGGQVLPALKTYNELAGLQDLEADHPLTELSQKLAGLLQSGNALSFSGEVRPNREYWNHELFHPRFTTRSVQGELGVIHLHCHGHFEMFEYEAGKIWDVPAGRENCVVEFYGKPGTKLELVEIPAN